MIKIYSGIRIEKQCGKQLHPITEVRNALMLIDKNEDTVVYSNSPDFISTAKYYAESKKIDIEFYLNNKKVEDIESIFEEFNKALDLMDQKIQ